MACIVGVFVTFKCVLHGKVLQSCRVCTSKMSLVRRMPLLFTLKRICVLYALLFPARYGPARRTHVVVPDTALCKMPEQNILWCLQGVFFMV